MKISISAFLVVFFVLISGCQSLPMNKLVSPTDDVKNWANINKAINDSSIINSLHEYSINNKKINITNVTENPESLKEQEHFEKFYKSLSAVYGKNDVAYQLIDSPVVKNWSEHVYSLSKTGVPTSLEISAWEFKKFGELLATNHNGLLSNLKNIVNDHYVMKEVGSMDVFTMTVKRKIEQPKTDKKTGEPVISSTTNLVEYESVEKEHNLAIILFDYLKKYGSGEFVDRYGNSISKPNITSSGISDEDIQGLATVFFEAIFDAWFTPPIYYTIGNKVEQSFKPDPVACDKDKKPENCKHSVTPEYSRIYFKEYITSGGEEPTSIKYTKSELVDDQDISAGNAKCIQQVTKLAGKGSKSLTGLGLGFLSNVNISFILGADFGVGDNKTLMHLVQTFSEVSTRRVAEYAAWKVLKKKDAVDVLKSKLDSIEVILCLVDESK